MNIYVMVDNEGISGVYTCLAMNHNINCLNVTLPANSGPLLDIIKPGLLVEGIFESGPSLMAFNSTVQAVIGGSMPLAKLSIWQNAWEMRKRETIRLGISLDVEFQHISTTSSNTFKMSKLEKEVGTVRPGRLTDLSLGGGGLETAADYEFNVGDFVRFQIGLIPGHPAATLLGAIVNVREIDPAMNDGMTKHLGLQFLALDDVSQRLLARAMRQLQEVSTQAAWLQAQKLLEQMRRNNVHEVADVSQTATRVDIGRPKRNINQEIRRSTTVVRGRVNER